jgi:DNA polymerase
MNPSVHDQATTVGASSAGPSGSLHLDARQRAMLAEMKMPVWWPQAAAEREPASAATVSARAAPASTSTPSPKGKPATPAASATHADRPSAAAAMPFPAGSGAVAGTDGSVEQMDWMQLREAVRGCSACALCDGRKAAVFSADPEPAQADWLIVGEPPDEHEERAGRPFAGTAGQLLDNMLRAVHLTRDGCGPAGARLTPVVKCRPAAPRNPTAGELARCAVYLQREIVLTQPRVIVAMGRFAALSLLSSAYPELLQLPFGQMRGKVYRCQGIAVVVTYHPSKLLRAPLQKAQVWADLCLARAQATRPPVSRPP